MAILFFSYSHKDEALRDQLETHLSMLQRQGFIEAWHDRRIPVGAPLDDIIDAQLEGADIVLLLVSSDFLGSDYCYAREMQRALERHRQGICVVVPVIDMAWFVVRIIYMAGIAGMGVEMGRVLVAEQRC